jgi:tetratricopeptide (TPR) repeat protein
MFNVARLAVICLLILTGAAAALELDSAYIAKIERGMELAFNDDYEQARLLFADMIRQDTTDHAPYLFMAAVLHAQMIDAEDYSEKPLFSRLIDRAIDLAERALDAGRRPAWAELTIGNAHGYVAALSGKQGSWFEALKRGVKAKNAYLRALEYDSTLYDAYVGLGNYHYWKSARTEFVNWLPFVTDRKQQGIEELKLARDSSWFSSAMAANSLMWIYIRSNQPEEALEIAGWLEERYPTARMVIWGQAYANFGAGRIAQAAGYFERLIEHYDSVQSNYFNLIECRYYLALIYRVLGQPEKAATELERLLAYPVAPRIAERQEDKLKQSRKLLEELQTRE